MIRETCICEQPTRAAISDCSRSSLEAQAEDLPGAIVEDRRQLLDRRAGLDPLEARIGVTDQVAGAGGVALLLVDGNVERPHGAALGGLQGLQDLLGRAADALGEVGDGGGAPEVQPEGVPRLLDGEAQLLEVARRAHVPRRVAEVAAQLPEDGRHGVAREREAAAGFPAVDRLDQPDRRDLDQVVERLGGAAVAQREAAGERHVPLDQLGAGTRLAVLVALREPHVLPLAAGPVVRAGPPARGARPVLGGRV